MRKRRRSGAGYGRRVLDKAHLLLDVVRHGGICANPILLHFGDEVALRQPRRRLRAPLLGATQAGGAAREGPQEAQLHAAKLA